MEKNMVNEMEATVHSIRYRDFIHGGFHESETQI